MPAANCTHTEAEMSRVEGLLYQREPAHSKNNNNNRNKNKDGTGKKPQQTLAASTRRIINSRLSLSLGFSFELFSCLSA